MFVPALTPRLAIKADCLRRIGARPPVSNGNVTQITNGFVVLR
jgi:hypothetical protein